MRSAEIRRRFLDYFVRRGHAERPSSSLVPSDDPTLLFTNAGMVQFKRVFLGAQEPPDGSRRATTSQKCVRAGGKHNDLEQVGHTARHHTFFEMLGNFSFGDYFKEEAIRFAWEFITGDVAKGNLGLPKDVIRVSVFHEDQEARALWREVAGLPDSRIYGLGAADNFWQMADTGPCGPCSEIYVDLARLADDWVMPAEAALVGREWTRTDATEFSLEAFVEGAEADRFLEVWNLVFMQFDRQADGKLVPLPRPSVDTGAGLERLAAVMQRVSNDFHTDLFLPLIREVERVVGRKYEQATAGAPAETPESRRAASFRVLADHARAVAFLLADGVFPSNDGRGYVVRRILRRAVRHAWLLGRRAPTLVHAVERVIETMRDVYPELHVRKTHIVDTTRAEEERFLQTIDGGMTRFDELAPVASTQGSSAIHGTIAGDDAFRLYDTYGFPIDLTELMARERGYLVDIAGFEAALARQRALSQEERKSKRISMVTDDLGDAEKWEQTAEHGAVQRFVGYDTVEIETIVTAVRHLGDGRVAVMLRETPFYAESGGQISDRGEILGDGWRVDVDEVKNVEGKIAAIGALTGKVEFDLAVARVPAERRRDTERNHTATHLLHAALREVLGEHVHQAGSVVEPDRLRFDFTHHGPLKPAQLETIERRVNDAVWRGVEVKFSEKKYADAVKAGAMALFGEKYGDVVRVVEIPGLSTELCGGCHVRNTGLIGGFRILSESGVSAGVRRIVAATGPRAFEAMRARERTLEALAERLKVNVHAVPGDVLEKKLDALIGERKALEKQVAELRKSGGSASVVAQLAPGGDAPPGVPGGGRTSAGAFEPVGAHRLVATRVRAENVKQLQAIGDSVREQMGSVVGVLGAAFADGKAALLVVVSDALREKGVSASDLVKAFAKQTGARGGGKPHMAQAGLESEALDEAVLAAAELARAALRKVE
ncbi:MAG TPA: alanine--tRNA ligase [Gemmatimonadaceae bacterium]|nr:alanine--tRNA ligase [Gemmatimonadaceae bacterium]